MRSIEQAFDGRTRNVSRTRRIAMAAPAHIVSRSSARLTHPSPTRLTRRGRVVVVLAALALLVLAGFTLGRVSSQAAGPAAADRHRPPGRDPVADRRAGGASRRPTCAGDAARGAQPPP